MQSCYFAAVDDETALRVREPGPLAREGLPVVEADGVIPLLSIPRLLALVSGTEAVLDLALVDHLWPRMPDDPGADTSWMAEPIVERLSPALCEDLAAIDLSRAAELAERWGPVVNRSPDDCEQLLRDLVALARTAREQGSPLYSRYALQQG